MIYADTSSDGLPVAERWDCWREKVCRMIMPMAFRREQDTEFRSTGRRLDLGGVRVTWLRHSSMQYHRSAKFVRQSDPEQLHLDLNLRGRTSIALAGRKAAVIPVGDFMLYDTSRPVRASMLDDADEARHLLVQVPRALVPLPADTVDRLGGAPLSGRSGIGALLSSYLTELVGNAHQYQPADAARLSTVTVDLLTTLLAHHLDVATPHETHQRALRIRVHDFIQRRLGDPRLSPTMVAAAHGISRRYLHKLFHDEGLTVAGWIRHRRLERCRHDLADPRLRSRPVHAIAARWGFADGAHFSRLFRATYGIPPSDYRRLAGGGNHPSIVQIGLISSSVAP